MSQTPEPTTSSKPVIMEMETIPLTDLLQKAGQIKILDLEGKELLFNKLYPSSSNGQRQRVMVIFIRHFFCGVCQDYLKALAEGIPTESLLNGLSIVIIGMGAASLIPSYTKEVSTPTTPFPYPIYANPTQDLYSLLGMESNLEVSSNLPDYQTKSIFAMTMKSAWQLIKRTTSGDSMSGGPFALNGGEFLFEAGEAEEVVVNWCHRMKTTQDHTEVPQLREVLGIN